MPSLVGWGLILERFQKGIKKKEEWVEIGYGRQRRGFERDYSRTAT